ncbi:hypothetical protein RvY_14876-2 [Ramazzottius varieornatus]|uniref:Uncharacterized protein n=1 Tax=Ramazzottius varieornatus TaxID=947166 RepID=A0A1D1VZZ9_RAMVA|nr:hypothetical protein RvY_14876-2 [Ramazzottius varieornatus]
MPFDSLEATSPPTGKCDHSAIQFRALIRWKFDEQANIQYREDLRNTDGFSLFAGKDTNGKAEVLEETLLEIAKKYHRRTHIKRRFGEVSYPAFVTRVLRRRDRAFMEGVICGDAGSSAKASVEETQSNCRVENSAVRSAPRNGVGYSH